MRFAHNKTYAKTKAHAPTKKTGDGKHFGFKCCELDRPVSPKPCDYYLIVIAIAFLKQAIAACTVYISNVSIDLLRISLTK